MASEFIERQRDDFFRDITSFGSLWFYLIFLLFLLIIKIYDVFKKLAFGLILMYVITILIRSFYFKNRPQKYSYNNFLEKLDASSFPSLHSQRAAFLTLTLIKFFNNSIISFLLIVLALVITYSRIYLKKHDLKDASAGVVVGVVVYFIVDYVFI